jgi:pyridoxamine 5'-phosphate oxidase-like protein
MSDEPVARRPRAPDRYEFSHDPDGLLPWSYALDRLVPARNYWVATTRPSGTPHATPVWGVWLDNVLHLDGSPESRWSRNIAANPRVSVNLESADDVVILEGTAYFGATDRTLGRRITDAWHDKYARLVPDPVGDGIFTVHPRRARAWHDGLADGTVWVFG